MALTLPSVVIQDLTFTAKQLGGDITVTYTNLGTAGHEVVHCAHDSRAITVDIQSGVSTATQILTAVTNHTRAGFLCTVTVSGTGSNVQLSAVSATLTGGADAVKASLVLAPLTFTAVAAGTAGNSITVTYHTGTLACSVSSSAISITFPVGTLGPVVAAKVNSTSAASALVVCSCFDANKACVQAQASSAQSLASGAAAVAASVVVQDLTLSQDVAGAAGNGATVTYVDDVEAGSETVSVSGNAATVHIDSGESTATQINTALTASDAFNGAKATNTVTVVSFSAGRFTAATPSGTITFGTPSNGDTVVFTGLPTDGPKTFTMAASASGNNFHVIADLTTLINALTDLNATDNGTVITMTVATKGTPMNAATITGTGSFAALSRTFSGGKDALVITVNGTALTESTDFNSVTDNNTTATNIAAAAPSGYTGVAVGAVVTFTYGTRGSAGNAKTLTTSNVSAATVGGATFSGGTDAFAVTTSGTGSTAQVVVNGVAMTGAVGEGPRTYKKAAADIALTSAYVLQQWSFVPHVLRINNDETSGSKAISISVDGATEAFVLNPTESLNLVDPITYRGLYFKYISGAPAYRIAVLG